MKVSSIALMVFFSVFLIACSKNKDVQQPSRNDQPTESLQKHTVAFNLNNFKVSYNERQANKEVAAKDYLTILSIVAFDSAGNHANSFIHNTVGGDMQTFGTLSLQLKPGTYTFMVEGTAKEQQQLFTDFLQLNTARLMTSLSHDDLHGSDVFYKKFTFTVADRDTTIETVRLDRLTGLLEVQFTDTLPENVERVDVKAYDAPFSYYVNEDSVRWRDSMFVGRIARNTVVDSLKVNNYFFGTSSPMTVVIKAYDKDDNFMYEKKVENVFVYRNKKTILKGKLYPSNLSIDVPVTVDSDYTDTVTQNF